MNDWRRVATATMLAGLLALAGCSQPVGGNAAPGKNKSGPLTAAAALGDFRTVDPCSLADLGALEKHGSARTLTARSFDHCRIAVTVGDENIEVTLGLLRHVDALGENVRQVRTLGRETTIIGVPASGDTRCERALAFSGDVTTGVHARVQDSTGGEVDRETLCAVATTGAQGIFDAATTGAVEHRKPPHNSLARVSACGLLPDDKIAEELGITSEKVTLYPAEHQCRWGRTGGDTATVKLDFVIGKDVPGTRGTPVEDIQGRKTAISASDTGRISVCTLNTNHVEFAQARDGEREGVVIRVLVPSNAGKDACEIGRTLAGIAWQRLPAA